MAEIALGSLAVNQGMNSDVKAFGQHMVDDHTKANEELKSAAAQSQAEMPSAPSAAQKKTASKLESMKAAEFDRAYADTMVKDHEQTVALFKQEASTGKDPGLKAFAAKTLPTLQQHLEMAKALKPGR